MHNMGKCTGCGEDIMNENVFEPELVLLSGMWVKNCKTGDKIVMVSNDEKMFCDVNCLTNWLSRELNK